MTSSLHIVPGLTLAFGVALIGPAHFERLAFVAPGEPERLAEFNTTAEAQAAIRAAEAASAPSPNHKEPHHG